MSKPTTTVEPQTKQTQSATVHREADARSSLKDLLLSDEAEPTS